MLLQRFLVILLKNNTVLDIALVTHNTRLILILILPFKFKKKFNKKKEIIC